LKHKDISHLNISKASNEIQEVIVSQQRKVQDQDRVNAEFYQTFKELTPMLFKTFHEIERKGTLSNSLYEASIT
jgi:hypothetical protein